MPADLEPEVALERKSANFGPWLRGASGRWAHIAEIDSPCPQCDSPVICAYANTGSPDVAHTFAHVCRSAACDWCEEHSEVESNTGGGNEPPPCYFCGREV